VPVIVERSMEAGGGGGGRPPPGTHSRTFRRLIGHLIFSMVVVLSKLSRASSNGMPDTTSVYAD
jgi:hypothetical protein